MDTIKIAIVSFIVAIGVTAVAYSFTDQTPNRPTPGAVSSPDIMSPYLAFGGVREWAGSTEMRAAASTTCAIQSPAATSTLISASANIKGGIAYATQVEIGAGATAFATTTRLALMDVGTSFRGPIIATSTAALIDQVVAPNTYINVKFATTTASATWAPIGTCSAKFREI